MGSALHPLPGKAGTRVALNALPTLSSLAGLFFPDRCRTCERVLDQITRVPVCESCWTAIVPQSQHNVCEVCGIASLARCPDCAELTPGFAAARSYGEFSGTLREVLHWYKFRGIEALAKPLGERLALVARQELFAGCQIVASVPLDPSRKRERGYNQAEGLARVVAKQLKLPLLPAGALRRTRSTVSQSGLSRVARRENVTGAFSADRAKVGGRTILLIDDVMTTGATLDACARTLTAAGATHVFALTVARTPMNELR